MQFLKYTKAVTCNLVKNNDADFDELWKAKISDEDNAIKVEETKAFI